MTTQVPPLMEILTDIPDPRQPSGKRYPLAAMLTLACVAVLCGHPPSVGDTVKLNGVTLRVEEMEELAVEQVSIRFDPAS